MRERLLCDIPVGSAATVAAVSDETGLRRRLYDVGFIRGACIAVVGKASGGRIRAYRVAGATIALRQSDARTVTVTEASP